MASASTECMYEDDEEEEVGGRFAARTEKEHSISAPGISDLTSVHMFKTRCARELDKFPYGVLPASESRSFANSLARKMTTTTSRVKELKRLCK